MCVLIGDNINVTPATKPRGGRGVWGVVSEWFCSHQSSLQSNTTETPPNTSCMLDFSFPMPDTVTNVGLYVPLLHLQVACCLHVFLKTKTTKKLFSCVLISVLSVCERVHIRVCVCACVCACVRVCEWVRGRVCYMAYKGGHWQAGDVWCLSPVWNLKAAIWLLFYISSHVPLPNPVVLSVLSFIY